MRQTLAADAPNTSPICAGCSRKKVLSKALASTGSFAYGAPSFSGAWRPAPDKALVAQLDRAPDYESGGREFESSRARHSSHRYPQNTQRFDLSASSRANKWSYIMTKVAAPRLYLSRCAILPAQILDRLSCRRSGGLAISCAEIKLFFAKVASISWGRCKVKNKGDGKPEKSQGPVLQRHIRSTSLRFPSDSKADD